MSTTYIENHTLKIHRCTYRPAAVVDFKESEFFSGSGRLRDVASGVGGEFLPRRAGNFRLVGGAGRSRAMSGKARGDARFSVLQTSAPIVRHDEDLRFTRETRPTLRSLKRTGPPSAPGQFSFSNCTIW